uniref:Thaumatin-like protein n=1 Tax=Dendroctonus ponderosae TaxID=77166 RepID=J3JYG5_DENPD|nr:unknown [Dendroctonus ponderosae]
MKLALYLATAAIVVVCSQAATFNINNKDGGPIWVGIQGNTGKEHLANGGFKLAQGESRSLTAADDWGGRFWSRTWCYEDENNHCHTGDCGNKVECEGAGGTPPATLIEFTLQGYGGLDYYDISLVDGYNSMASVEPVNGQGDGGEYSCKKAQCATQINSLCPSELQVKSPDGGSIIACNSACNAFLTEEYCCSGSHSTPETCKSSDWAVDYPAIFKSACPDAYSYAYDDHKSTFTCVASQYNINFGSA